MSQIILNTEYFIKNGLTDEEALFIILLHRKCDLERAKKNLIEKGFIDIRPNNLFEPYVITESGIKAINKIILDSDKSVPKESKSLEEFADSLRLLFPKGTQQGKYSWRGSTKEIVERLRVFFREFGDYSQEDIIQATKNYLARMEGDSYMRTLPYFLWDKRGGNYSSLLANELAILKEGEDESSSTDWRNTIV